MAPDNQMNKQTNNTDGFEDSPYMVPGVIETAQEYDAQSHVASGPSQKAKLIFAMGALIAAGGWTYAKQDDFKQAMGFSPAASSACSSRMETGCPQGFASMRDPQGCCPSTVMGAQQAGMCCESSQQQALMTALLKHHEKSRGSLVADADLDQPLEATLVEDETFSSEPMKAETEAVEATTEETFEVTTTSSETSAETAEPLVVDEVASETP